MSPRIDRQSTRGSSALLSKVLPALLPALFIVACRAAEPPAASSSTSMAAPVPAKPTQAAASVPEPAKPADAPSKAGCGAAGQRGCPTQRWMKATLQAYLRTRDYKRLESSFKTLATRVPDGFPRWGEMAESGAQGAARSDDALIRKSCQDCHDSYRARFREQNRGIELL